MSIRTLLLCLALPAFPLLARADDAGLIVTYRAGMQSLVRATDVPRALVPSTAEREDARAVWKSFLDYQLALESIRERHRHFIELRGTKRAAAFRLYHAAWLAQYRGALDFVAHMERHPELHTILNESVPSLGLSEGSYAAFKLHWLHVARAAEWTLFALLDRTLGGTRAPGADDDARAVLAAGAGRGSKETLRNAARVVGEAAWRPLPKAASMAAAAAGHEAPRPSFVSKQQIAAARARVQPGDLLFERRDWSLTNVGLPGFWPHVALYVGTPAERRALFGEEFEQRLRARDPRRYEELARAEVIEATSENVIATTFAKSADADYLAVIRPNVETGAKGEAVARAFAMLGRPYDFEFDFVTDDRIVCSELVFKAYEQQLALPLLRVAGRSVTPPNDFVRWFDEQYDTPNRPATFVAFFDGHGHRKSASAEDVEEFRRSWRRPRWHPVVHQD